LRKQTGTLDYRDLGGLAKSMPLLSFLFGLAAYASIGLPGFANFASELLVFFGAFKTATPGGAFNGYQIATVCALWGLVISAVYMLRAYRNIFFGERSSRWANVKDVSLGLGWPVLLLLAGLIVFGFAPQAVLQKVEPGMALFWK
ncbi:MAG TPA: proton-conducting transporter membrane subunit, partial [Chthoniobacterales bacterium]|nr:proton-conducting transporter membrane subunit [Chthoniobacterales bacterium]